MADVRQLHDRKEAAPPPLPSAESITNISTLLSKQFLQQRRATRYAPVKEILTLLGAGALLSATLLAPKAVPLLKTLTGDSTERDEWKRYNPSYLKRTLQRLEKQKQVEIAKENGQQVIRLTTNGQRKILKYSLDHLTVDKPKRWDRKWRLVLYDIPIQERGLSDLVRQAIRTIGFYAIQDSVYIYPYPCFDQIEFLREYYQLGDNVQYMMVDYIERDHVFKTYFGLS